MSVKISQDLSVEPSSTAIISTTILATSCGAVAAVSTAKLLQRFFPYEETPRVDVTPNEETK